MELQSQPTPYEIGDVTFCPRGDRLRIEIAEQQNWCMWTVAGAQAAVAYLQAWINTNQCPQSTMDTLMP